MTKFGWLVVGGALLIIAIIASAIYFIPKSAPAPAPPVSDFENLIGKSIYASGEYGFTIVYPETAYFDESVAWAYHLSNSWRMYKEGYPIVAIFSYTHESENSFPRYFASLVRIGASDAAEDVAECLDPLEEQGEVVLPDRIINGTTWKAFSFQDAAMMKYEKGVSYRAIHDGRCYALEKIATGSSYQDDPDSPEDIPQEKLDAEYAALDAIIETFEFSGS